MAPAPAPARHEAPDKGLAPSGTKKHHLSSQVPSFHLTLKSIWACQSKEVQKNCIHMNLSTCVSSQWQIVSSKDATSCNTNVCVCVYLCVHAKLAPTITMHSHRGHRVTVLIETSRLPSFTPLLRENQCSFNLIPNTHCTYRATYIYIYIYISVCVLVLRC